MKQAEVSWAKKNFLEGVKKNLGDDFWWICDNIAKHRQAGAWLMLCLKDLNIKMLVEHPQNHLLSETFLTLHKIISSRQV